MPKSTTNVVVPVHGKTIFKIVWCLFFMTFRRHFLCMMVPILPCKREKNEGTSWGIGARLLSCVEVTHCIMIALSLCLLNRTGTCSIVHPSIYISPLYCTGRKRNGTDIDIRHAVRTGTCGVVCALKETVFPVVRLYTATTRSQWLVFCKSMKFVCTSYPFFRIANRIIFMMLYPSITPIVS